MTTLGNDLIPIDALKRYSPRRIPLSRYTSCQRGPSAALVRKPMACRAPRRSPHKGGYRSLADRERDIVRSLPENRLAHFAQTLLA